MREENRFTELRIRKTAEQLMRDGFVKSSKLAEQYGVSMETIRKDLHILEQNGIAQKVHGGAILAGEDLEQEMLYRTVCYNSKQEIGRFAATFLQGCRTLLLDSGSTVLACVRYINKLPRMTVITTSIPAFEALDGDHHDVFLTGGKKREKNLSLTGAWTEESLSGIHVDVCFLGTAGIKGCGGPTVHYEPEKEMKRKMVNHSKEVYVLADSSKFREKGTNVFAGFDEIDGIITDHGITSSMYTKWNRIVPVHVSEE